MAGVSAADCFFLTVVRRGYHHKLRRSASEERGKAVCRRAILLRRALKLFCALSVMVIFAGDKQAYRGGEIA